MSMTSALTKREEKMTEKNYAIRKMDLMLKIRRQFHRPTRSEDNPRAYSRKEKHRTNYLEMPND
tara:strand:+ start:1040 stop:1231 length:192 start_codon:yes stop_codon:yes gene_type:complete